MSTLFDALEASGELFGKTCPESSQPKTTPSAVCWADLSEAIIPCLDLAGEHGQNRVWLPGLGHGSLGGFSTLNISASPNNVRASSLSQVLWKGAIPLRYFLSAEACAGILRRAAKRGKKLLAPLRLALETVAEGRAREPMKPQADTCNPP